MNTGENQRMVRKDPIHHRPLDRPLAAPSGRYLAWKGKVEWVAALLLLILTSPLIALAALLVKLTSRGPAFYNQTRLGKHGRPYTIHKIRTMHQNAECGTGPRWATKHDPRATLVGGFLRRSHLDELPQLWNVLRGEMSLIGPRPERPEFVNQLAPLVPHYRERMQVLPGVTGLAQVLLPPDSDLVSVRRKLSHDLHYLEHVSFRLDVKIVLATACGVLHIPAWLTLKLFPLPSSEKIEADYERRAAADDNTPKMQSA